jgi:hypothetical protein
MDARGTATVTWLEQYGADPTSFRVMAARRPAGGRFGVPQLVASDVETRVDRTYLEVGAGGHAIILWTASPRQGPAFVDAAVAGPDGSFGEPQRIGSSSGSADVAVDGQGRMLVLWSALDGAINASSAAPGAPFGPGRVVAGSVEGWSYPSAPQVALGTDGTAVAVWSRFVHSTETNAIESALRTASGTWRAPEVVTNGPWSFDGCCPVIDAKGTARMIWIAGTNRPGDDRHIATSFRPADGGWQEPKMLVPPTDANLQALDLAANASGDAIAVWWEEGGIESAYLRDGRWGLPVSPWRDASAKSPAIDAAGNAFVVWSSGDRRGNYFLRAGGYDAAGPQLRRLRVPTRGRVGKPLRFSTSPLDVWSGRTAARWGFGDGGKATGRSVAHSYRRAGTYTVVVSSSDQRGHVTTAKRRIRIR